jgi:hypothetical protein
MVEGALNTLLSFYLKGPFSPYVSSIHVADPVSEFNQRARKTLIDKVECGKW